MFKEDMQKTWEEEQSLLLLFLHLWTVIRCLYPLNLDLEKCMYFQYQCWILNLNGNYLFRYKQGVKENSKEIGLEDKVKIDLVVVGSVAVSRNGKRDRDI